MYGIRLTSKKMYDIRFEKAKELINKGVSVTKVAEITGFCDYGYFGKTFKKITGTTPTQVKNKNNN